MLEGIYLIETLEHQVLVLLADADAGVGHAELGAAVGRKLPDAQLYRPFLGELHGIVQQLQQDDTQGHAVALEGIVVADHALEVQLQPSVVEALRFVYHLAAQLVHRDVVVQLVVLAALAVGQL